MKNNSFYKNRIGIGLMFLSSLCVCFGQMFWKQSVGGSILFLILGFALYGLGMLIIIVAYKFGSLSVLQPMLSLNFVFTPLIGYFILGEAITPAKLAGIAAIFLGVVIIGGGDG